MKKSLHDGLKPIPESKMSPQARRSTGAWARDAEKTHRATPSRIADDHLERRQSPRSSGVKTFRYQRAIRA
jgi:hypothetical protein